MRTIIKKQPVVYLKNKWKEIIFDTISYLFVLLFVHTATSKLITYPAFLKVLGDLPVIGKYRDYLAPLILGMELIISLMLIIPTFKNKGIIASLLLMTAFTSYLLYMILTGNSLPCSCGGAISGMSWKEHILFNLACIGLAIFGIILRYKRNP